MSAHPLDNAGTVTIGGELAIHRLGYGGFRLTGEGCYGPTPHLDDARATLRLLPELGVDFVQTSIAFGPMVSECLIRQALHPYAGMTIGTGGGVLRPAPFEWRPHGHPISLRKMVETSIAVLGVDHLDLWFLDFVDPQVPADDQFGAIADMQRAGLIRHAGLSSASTTHIAAANKHFPVAAVQNRYNLTDRRSEGVLEQCERLGIPFLAFYPLATGAFGAADSILRAVAAKIGITPAQAAIAWLLHRSKSIVVFPGTIRPDHLRENVAAADIRLSDEQYRAIERVGQRAVALRSIAHAARPPVASAA